MKNKVSEFYVVKSVRKTYGDEIADSMICKRSETRKPCSCVLCGNPRRLHKDKKTIQEKRFEESTNE